VIIYVHGGVSGMRRARRPDLSYAIVRGLGASVALDAIEAAIVDMEDDPELNAGYGAVLNRAGELELDAGIADGSSGLCGAVAGVAVRHPISLARRVLESTPHVLVAGEGATQLGADMEKLDDTSPEQRERWKKASARGRLSVEHYGAREHVDTVGAVALDHLGGLAAGSSTGGVFGQLPGRVGDAPIFGAGFYASAGAAVVGTGIGELFIRTQAAARAGALIEAGHHPARACEQIVGEMTTSREHTAGLLALDRDGRIGAAFHGGSLAVEGPDGAVDAIRVSPAQLSSLGRE
jgi:L-asparaginase / beta-aspartyl-peptidase